jgi:hypothetical protein
MPANAGIHGFPCCDKEKPWIPAFAGVTSGASPVIRSFGRLLLE